MHGLAFDIAHLLAGGLVLVSFMLLYQDRLYALLNVFALHALVLAAVGRLAGLSSRTRRISTSRRRSRWSSRRSSSRSRCTASIVRLGIHREIETVVGIGPTMLAGMGLVALSMVVMLRVTAEADPLAREDLAFALSVVLLGLLMMVTRRNAVSQVVGFMSLENGLVLAATGAKGMPLVVEISVAFSILIAFIVIGIFLFRIRERFDTVDVRRSTASAESADDAFDAARRRPAAIPRRGRGAAGAAARLPADARGSTCWRRLLTFLAALSLFVERPAPGAYLLVDDLNIVFIVLNTFVGFTTSVFSASYIAHELETGRLTPANLRFYHAMYQVLMFAMNLALRRQQYRPDVGGDRARDADHRADGRHLPHARGARGGLEILHPRQRRHRARAVRHHPRLHGGAAGGRRRARRHGLDRADRRTPATFDPALLNVAFVFLLLGYGTKVGLAPLHAWLPDAHAEGPTPISAVLSGLLLNVALYAVLRFKMLLAANPGGDRARAADGDDGAGLADLRGVHALPPARHQTHVRLLLDRAYGHHRLRLRHGRPARQFRRAAAHDDALA